MAKRRLVEHVGPKIWPVEENKPKCPLFSYVPFIVQIIFHFSFFFFLNIITAVTIQQNIFHQYNGLNSFFYYE